MNDEKSKEEFVDLIEIYYARSVRDQLRRELKRLRGLGRATPGLGPVRRLEIGAYYERMLITNAELLRNLGDIDVQFTW